MHVKHNCCFSADTTMVNANLILKGDPTANEPYDLGNQDDSTKHVIKTQIQCEQARLTAATQDRKGTCRAYESD